MKAMYKIFPLNRFSKSATALICALMVSCGGGSSTVAGIGGTGITSGEITQFGSVYVNGVRFNTDNSQFELDGDTFTTQGEAETAGLSEGMVAKIYGTTNGDGVTGTATLVEYDNEVEGPVTNLTELSADRKSFDVFNLTVYIDRYGTTFKDTDFDILDNDIIVEVSGLIIANNEVMATFIKKEEGMAIGAEVEIEGVIDSVGANSFTIGSVTIDYTTNPDIDIKLPGGVPAVDLLVEVHGFYQGANVIEAVEIDEEDEDFGSDIDHISLEGIIADFTNTTDLLFTINGQFVDASGAVFYDTNEMVFIPTTQLADGVRIEVEGTIIGGMLFADEVELD